ncbi:MAG: hypothetical protein A3G44_15645 [Candidatus Rokubacteria bacterium RIFCSPLOWO2_12_FULL_73_47]|nr:MAG: hypothetical protein A3G44_15645 [Candidatus Rokubacteria bacterium RIFCSPLOWO2_12_FULL_73_47]
MMSSPSLLDTMKLCGLTGESWSAWRAVAKVLDGDGAKLTSSERAVYEVCTGRTRVPTEPPAEAWIIKGRRGGGSRFLGAAGTRAARRRYALAPGERAVVAFGAADRDQARVVHSYATAPFRAELHGLVERRSGWAALKALVSRETRWSIDLTTGVSLEVHTSHFGRIRGRTFAFAGADEAAFWQSEDGSANPASEVFAAIRPGLVTLGGQLVVVTTPYAKRGPVWDTFSTYHGVDDDRVLVWRAASTTMNPTIPERAVQDALERDQSAARAEWLAEFRSDLESFVSSEALHAVVVPGRTELEPRLGEGGDYFAFVDPAGGSGQDSMTLAIAHAEKYEDDPDGPAVAVLDALAEHRPPFDPDVATAECAALLRRYGLARVTGDRYGAEWVRGAFERCGITYDTSARTRSELYAELLPLVNARRVELLDHQRMLAQLAALERRPVASGREAIDHPQRGHDDLVNAAAGALVLAHADAAEAPLRVGVL